MQPTNTYYNYRTILYPTHKPLQNVLQQYDPFNRKQMISKKYRYIFTLQVSALMMNYIITGGIKVGFLRDMRMRILDCDI